MRRAVVILLAVLLMQNVAASALPEAGDNWLVLKRRGTKHPEVVMVVRELPPPQTRSRFRVLLRFEWGYASLPNGMPTEEEIARGKELYLALDRIVGAAGVHAMTRTGDGGRTIYYYVEDPAPMAGAIREYFDSLPPISVRVSAREEPEWDSVREVLDGVR